MIEIPSQIFLWIGLLISFALLIASFSMAGKARRFALSTFIHLNLLVIIPLIITDPLSFLPVSLPCLAIYYYFMYQIAEVVVPSFDRDDKKERWKQFWVFFWYSWGLQYPIWIATDHAGRQIETRIPGKFTREFGMPGMIYADSHHAIGVTDGPKFSKVEGPGIAFTNRFERPYEIIDLRTQVRNREIQALTKDGVQFKTRLVAAFSVDRDAWGEGLHSKLSTSNPRLRNAMYLDHTLGIYPFSSKRVREVIAFGAKNSPVYTEQSKSNWDDMILDKIEPIASQVLAQRNLNELWIPKDKEKYSYVADEIANEIFEKAHNRLRKRGIHLYISRIVNFRFTKGDGMDDDSIPEKQLEAWRIPREARTRRIIEDAKSTAKLEEDKVHADITKKRFEILKGVRDPEVARQLEALRIVTSMEKLDKREANHSRQLTDDPPKTDDDLEPRIKKYIEEILPGVLLQMNIALAKGKEDEK